MERQRFTREFPNSYNSRPNCGNIKIKRLSYTWRSNSKPPVP
jgi:hypothetical protein